MESKLGRLKIDLVLGQGPLVAGVKTAIDSVKKFGSATALVGRGLLLPFTAVGTVLGGLFRTLTSVKTLLAGTIAVIATSRLARDFHSAAVSVDQLGKASKRLGVSVQSLSALRFAAGEAGVDFETLAKMAGRASKSLAEVARTGKGAAADAVRELGLTLKDSTGRLRAIDELIPDIARAMQGLAAGDQLDLANKIFGREGGEQFVTWLAESGDLVADLAQKTDVARRIGVVFTDDQVKKLTAYNDAVERIAQAWLGIKVRLMTELAPALTRIADTMTGLVAGLPEIIGRLGATIRGAIRGDLGDKAKSELAHLGSRIADLFEHIGVGAMTAFISAVRAGFKSMPTLLGPIAQESFNAIFGIGSGLTVGMFERLAEGAPTDAWKKRYQGIAEYIRQGSAGLQRASDEVAKDDIRRFVQDVMTASEGAVGPFTEWGRQLATITVDIASTTDSLIGYTEAIAKHNPALAQAIQNTAAWGRASREASGPLADFWKGARAGLANLKAEAGDLAKLGQTMTENLGRNIADGIGDALTQAQLHAKSFGEAIKLTMKSVAESVLGAINRFIMLRAITAGMDFIGGLSWTGSGGGSSSGINLNATGTPGTAYGARGLALDGGRILGLAAGGILTSTTLLGQTRDGTRVVGGEAGPEAVMPLTRIGGDLGVRAAMPDVSAQPIVVQIVDQRSSGERPTVETSQGPDGQKVIRVLIRDEVSRAIGDGSLDKVMASSYGASRRGVRR